MLYRSVRDAFEGSVACTRPFESRHMRNVSTLPKSNSPRSAFSRAPGTLSRIHFTFVPEKYASVTNPVRSRISLSKPFAFSASQIGTVSRLCHTMALKTGLPVDFSQTLGEIH